MDTSLKLEPTDQIEKIQYYLISLVVIGIAAIEVLTILLIIVFPDSFLPCVNQPCWLASFGVLGTLLIFGEWAYLIKNKTFKFGIAEGLYLSMIVFSGLSLVFSQSDDPLSLGFSWATREGPEHFLAYYWLFYASSKITNIKYRRNILNAYLITAVLNAVVSFLQSIGIGMEFVLYTPPIYEGQNYAFGFTLNPNSYGGLSVVLVALTAGCFIFGDKLSKNKAFSPCMFILSLVLLYTAYASRARLAWVGCLAVVVFYIISLCIIKRKDIMIRFGILLIAFVLVTIAVCLFTDFIIANVERTTYEIGTGDIEYNLGSQRLYTWRFGLESLGRYWPFGVGLDHYEYVFYLNPKFTEGMLVNFIAHNEYLQILTTQGVFAFAAHMTAIIYAVVVSVRKIVKEYDSKEAVLQWIFLSMLVGYMAKAIFDCGVFNVAPYAWCALGLCMIPPRRKADA